MSIRHRKHSALPDGADPSKVHPSDWNDEHVDDDGSAVSPLYRTSLDLVHVEILQLSDGDFIPIVPAPGSGRILVPQTVLFSRRFVAPYTGANVAFDSVAVVWINGNRATGILNPGPSGAGSLLTFMTATPDSGEVNVFSPGLMLTLVQNDSWNGVIGGVTSSNDASTYVNSGLFLRGQLDGPLGGGDADNVMRVTIDYVVMTVI